MSEFLVLIQKYFLCKKNLTQTNDEIDNYYEKWFTDIRYGLRSTSDSERSEQEAIGELHDMVLIDRRLKVRQIVRAIDVSHGLIV